MFTLGLGQGGGTPVGGLLVRELDAKCRCEVVVSDSRSLVGFDGFAAVVWEGSSRHAGEVKGRRGGRD